MNDDELIKLMLAVDPQTKRIPPGLRAIASAVEAAERERCALVCEARALDNLRLGTMAHPVVHEMLEARDAEAQCCAVAIRLGPNVRANRPDTAAQE